MGRQLTGTKHSQLGRQYTSTPIAITSDNRRPSPGRRQFRESATRSKSRKASARAAHPSHQLSRAEASPMKASDHPGVIPSTHFTSVARSPVG